MTDTNFIIEILDYLFANDNYGLAEIVILLGVIGEIASRFIKGKSLFNGKGRYARIEDVQDLRKSILLLDEKIDKISRELSKIDGYIEGRKEARANHKQV